MPSADPLLAILPGWLVDPFVAGFSLADFIGLFILLNFILFTVMALIYVERKVLAWIQLRVGPMHVGPWGLLQSPADAIKLLTKEDLTPAAADRRIFKIAPYLVFIPTFLIFVTIPFGPFLWFRNLVVRSLDLGLLYIVAVPALSAVGLVMAGWSSGNKYSLIGAARAVAQLISYELPLVVALLGVAMLTQSLSLTAVVEAQAASVWFVLLQPLGFFIFLTSALAEMNRTPFDITIAEGEIVGGPFVEYSGMRWALFFLNEYAAVLANAALAVTLFLGGWTLPGVPSGLGVVVFFVKTTLIILVIMWLRGTLPRLRIDQLMDLAWKALLPASFVNLILTGVLLVFGWLPFAIASAASLAVFLLWWSALRRPQRVAARPVRMVEVPRAAG